MAVKITNQVTGNRNTVIGQIVFSTPKVKSVKTEYPAGSIGADLLRRNYVKYLVERYHKFKEADGSFGKASRHSYAVIYKNIEASFKAPAYFVPVTRFDELVAYLQGRIDRTMLGKRNRSRGQACYSTFDEFEMEMSGDS